MDAADAHSWFAEGGEALSARLCGLSEAAEDDTDLYWVLFDFYNHLMARSLRGEAEQARSQAATAAETFRALKMAQAEAMFLEAVARITFELGDQRAALDALERMAAQATAEQASDVAALAKDLWDAVRGHLRLEFSGPVLAALSRIYASLGEIEPQVRLQLEAAVLYAHNGARAPARSALRDALVLAHDAGAPELEALVLAEALTVAYDARDAQAGLAAADDALEIWERLSKPAPLALRANRATLLAQLDRLDEAGDILSELLSTEPGIERPELLRANLASVRRRQGRLPEAQQLLTDARLSRRAGPLDEPDLELELIAAAIAADVEDSAGLMQALTAACEVFDAGLGSIFRLHHRRGFRERYLGRFEGLMRSLPDEGVAGDILPLIATVHAGLIADWLAVQDWAASLAHSVSPAIQAAGGRVSEALADVRRAGAPYLPRRVQNNDDAWLPNLEGRTWDALGLAVDAAVAAGADPPHRLVNLIASTVRLQKRLDEGWAVVAPTLHASGAAIWIVQGARYRRFMLDLKDVIAFRAARDRVAVLSMSREAFQVELARFVEKLRATLGALLDTLPPSCPGLLGLQDFFDSLPLMAVGLTIPGLRARMAAGQFQVRTVPVLYGAGAAVQVRDPAIVAVSDSDDDLVLAGGEGAAFAASFTHARLSTFEANDEGGIRAAMAAADVLVVSTHGQSIGRYTDPAFANLGGEIRPHAISVDLIQRDFLDLPFQLVLLNACHAGAAALPDIERGLRTHDAAGYPALLLMNRRCVVGAAGWKLIDSISLLYAQLIGEALAEGLAPVAALSRATALLRELSRTEIVSRFEAMPPSDDLKAVIQRFRDAKAEVGLFHHPYVCGGLGIYTLL